MATLGTFDAFNASRMGIYAAQHGLHITGNNISNINTLGYTRQRVDQVSFKTGSTDRYASWMDNHMGNGVLVSGISQIRDPFLDIRYRTTATDTYYYDSKLSGLQSIASILDEVAKGDNDGDGLIYAQLQDMLTQLRGFSANPTKDNDTLVRNSAESLASLFRFYANKLDELYANTESYFNKNITQVNEILTNIRDLNESIRDAEIHGDKALEMRDERNRQIDDLARYMSIRVEYSYEDVGAGIQVEKLTIKMGNSNPDKGVHTDESVLVDGVYATQLSVPKEKPVLNTYKNEYLQGYTYLKKVSTGDTETVNELLAALKEKGIDYTNEADLSQVLATVTETDDDGNVIGTYYLFGANDSDVEGIYTEKNDNYTVQLGKLLNRKAEEWKNSTTRWEEVDSATAARATYSFPVTLNKDNISVGDTLTFTITDSDGQILKTVNISVTANTTDEDIVAEIAKALDDSKKYSGYTISSDGTNLIFTPDSNPAPTDPPNLSFTEGTSTLDWLSVGSAMPATTYDEHGNVTHAVNYVEVDGKWYKVTVDTEYTHEIALDDNDLHGILQAQREMLTEEGEFASTYDVAIDENACIKRGIPYYIKSLDLLAQKFAEAYNELNQGYLRNQDGYLVDKDGNLLMVQDLDVLDDQLKPTSRPINASEGLSPGQLRNLINNGYFLMNDQGQPIDEDGNLILDENGDPLGYFLVGDDGVHAVDKDGNPILDENGQPIEAKTSIGLSPENYSKLVVDMERLGAVFLGGPLFSNGNNGNKTDDPPINAHNINISAGWSNGDWGLVPKFELLFDGTEHSTQNVNADHMVSLLLDKALTYDPRDLHGSDAIGPMLFEGTFNDYLSNMMGVEASDERITRVNLTTNDLMLTELDYNREGVSGVDLNDEAMNMIQYQKAMNAAMRLMTAIDEALDRLINNTGIAGR